MVRGLDRKITDPPCGAKEHGFRAPAGVAVRSTVSGGGVEESAIRPGRVALL